MIKTYTIPELAKALNENDDTLYRAKRNKAVSKRLARKIEDETGIHRDMWLYPDDYGIDAWDLIT